MKVLINTTFPEGQQPEKPGPMVHNSWNRGRIDVETVRRKGIDSRVQDLQ